MRWILVTTGRKERERNGLRKSGWSCVVLSILTILIGGIVAGVLVPILISSHTTAPQTGVNITTMTVTVRYYNLTNIDLVEIAGRTLLSTASNTTVDVSAIEQQVFI